MIHYNHGPMDFTDETIYDSHDLDTIGLDGSTGVRGHEMVIGGHRWSSGSHEWSSGSHEWSSVVNDNFHMLFI